MPPRWCNAEVVASSTVDSADRATKTPSSAYDLSEALASKPGVLAEDGTVLIHVIRPTIGQGQGRHKYTAEMLRENAEVFTGWKMYVDHQSSEARKAAGGLPRSIRDLGGRVMESWWDDSVPAEGRFGQGAVVARVKPVGQVKRLIEEDPQLLEASIRAKATDVYQDTEEGEPVWVVEGIQEKPPGSVDWVSEAGAGGRVADLIEGLVQESEAPEGVTEDEDEATTETEGAAEAEPKEDTSVEQLEEALRDPESGVSKAVRDLVESRSRRAVLAARRDMRTQMRKKLQEAEQRGEAAGRAAAEADAKKEAEKAIRLRDLRDEAHRAITEAALPQKVADKLMADYEVGEDGSPSPKIATAAETGDEAARTLKSSVENDLREAREIIAEVAPTRVEDQGPSDTDGEKSAAPVEKPFFQEFLEEAGIDPAQAYGNQSEKESV